MTSAVGPPEGQGAPRDLGRLVVARVGCVAESGDPFTPFVLLDPCGAPVEAVAAYLADLQAAGRSTTTQRSYAMALLRWFRFCWAIGADWDRVGRPEARDFCRWITLATKPARRSAMGTSTTNRVAARRPALGARNPVTGKPTPGRRYAPATGAHAETVCRHFYEFHREAGSGPLLNPFPLARARRGGRAHAHHNPAESYPNEPAGLYRPKGSPRVPRAIPDEQFNEIFAGLRSHRDRALVAFYVSTGARATELLGAHQSDVDVGSQLITVVRKGSRALQALPASPDAFVWLRLYQAQMGGLVPAGPDQALWWTLRPAFRPLSYHGAYRMFTRVAGSLGANWALHDLRHTAAHRMAADPTLPLTDVQWVLGHAYLTTTQIYLAPLPEDVIAAVLAHHARKPGRGVPPVPPAATQRYRPETLDVLFGGRRR
ncbi:MAG: tyrosine-type recombinase/integrase [Acidimicrobiales bacterium]